MVHTRIEGMMVQLVLVACKEVKCRGWKWTSVQSLHLLGLSVQFGVRASEDYDHPFLLFYTFGGFLAKYLYRYSRRHAIRIYPRYKRILVR